MRIICSIRVAYRSAKGDFTTVVHKSRPIGSRYFDPMTNRNHLLMNAFGLGSHPPRRGSHMSAQGRAERWSRGAPPSGDEYTGTKPCKGETNKRSIVGPPLQGSGDNASQPRATAVLARLALLLPWADIWLPLRDGRAILSQVEHPTAVARAGGRRSGAVQVNNVSNETTGGNSQ